MVDERVLRFMVQTREQEYQPERPKDPTGGSYVLFVDEHPDEQQRDGHPRQQPPDVFELVDLIQGCLPAA
ncbi:hypothetical protein D3C77_635200 [compost metagenome]